MAEIISFIIIIIIMGIIGIIKWRFEYKLDNYDMSKVDSIKLSNDVTKGISVAERRRRCVNGYYDKK